MSIKCVVDGFAGDCGKGKVTDYFAQDADIVVRYHGGPNSGHTIKNNYGKVALHMIPCGSFNEKCLNIIAPGVVFDPIQFFKEYDEILEFGANPRILISDRCQVIFPYHIDLNMIEEERLGKKAFGSTCKGVTQCYSDMINKVGLQVNELYLDDDYILSKLERAWSLKYAILNYYKYEEKTLEDTKLFITSPSVVLEQIKSYRDKLKPFIGNVSKIMNHSILEDKYIIMEGQLGATRDILHGIWNHVSGITCLSSYAAPSCGIPASSIYEVVCVLKSYVSFVGSGDFVTELNNDDAHELREINGEYGATSGRPRRLGWFDCVQANYGLQLQGATDVCLTCLDVLGHYDEIPVCVRYQDTRTMKSVEDFPITSELQYMSPVYYCLKGWKEDISDCKTWESLPERCRDYVLFLEKHLGRKIRYLSVGKDRDQFIDRDGDVLRYYNPKVIRESYYDEFTNEWSDKGL